MARPAARASASAAAEGRRPATSHGEDADHALDQAEDLDDLPITLETLGADEVLGAIFARFCIGK